MRKRSIVLPPAVLGAILSESAFAYVGPGAGLSLLGALWGLLVAVAAALGFIMLWPLRRMLRQRAAKRSADDQSTDRKDERPMDDDVGREAP